LYVHEFGFRENIYVGTERRGVPFDKTPEVGGINVLHLWYIEVAACSLEKQCSFF
jgi:hypothetical protein